jgi:hypothetical protein
MSYGQKNKPVYFAGLNFRLRLFTQYRWPVAVGPSSKM